MGAVIVASLLLLPWSGPTRANSIEGKATYYAPRLMQEVARNRGMELDGAIGYVALNRAGDLGRLIWIERKVKDDEGSGIRVVTTGPYRVVDCAQEGSHYETREDKGYIVEVPWELAVEWKMRGPISVKVLFSIPDPPGSR